MDDGLTLQLFTRCLGTVFTAEHAGEQALALELVEANALSFSARHEAFALLFRGPATPALTQGLYRVSHAAVGAFDLFVVPVRRDDDGLCYEAVFNRLVEATA